MFDDPLPLASQSVDTTAGRLYGLCTIGYGGRSLAEVMAMLIAAEVPLLVDVRTTPWTRLPGFGKHELARALPLKGG